MHDPMLLWLLGIAVAVAMWEMVSSVRDAIFYHQVCSKCAHCNAKRAEWKEKEQAYRAQVMFRMGRCPSCQWGLGMAVDKGRMCVNTRCKYYEKTAEEIADATRQGQRASSDQSEHKD